MTGHKLTCQCRPRKQAMITCQHSQVLKNDLCIGSWLLRIHSQGVPHLRELQPDKSTGLMSTMSQARFV